MRHYLYTFFDFLFPPDTDELTLRKVSDAAFLELYCYGKADEVDTLLPFSASTVRAAIHLAKFRAHVRATELLGTVLAHHLARVNVDYISLPIPLSRARARERGYNQVENILHAAFKKRLSTHKRATNVLVRTRHTKPQTTLARKERLTNVVNAFDIRDIEAARTLLAGKHVLIIDDVTTTGATLKAAKATLLPLQPASITLLSLAH